MSIGQTTGYGAKRNEKRYRADGLGVLDSRGCERPAFQAVRGTVDRTNETEHVRALSRRASQDSRQSDRTRQRHVDGRGLRGPAESGLPQSIRGWLPDPLSQEEDG